MPEICEIKVHSWPFSHVYTHARQTLSARRRQAIVHSSKQRKGSSAFNCVHGTGEELHVRLLKACDSCAPVQLVLKSSAHAIACDGLHASRGRYIN